MRVFDGVTSTTGAATLTLLAQSNDLAEAGIKNIGGGLIEIASSSSTAHGTPTVGVTLGGPSSVIRVSGAISAKAVSSYDADASTYSATGGALNVSSFNATAWMKPTSTALITGGASIVAGGLVISAQANPPLPPASDGTFDAVGGVDGTAHTITFGANHNSNTGDTVTYNTLGQPTISGLTPGRTYSIIVIDATSVQLGVVFSDSNVDTVLDTINFGTRSHGLNTGDVLLYQLVSGNPLSAIGGLTANTLYEVYKVDDHTIKLRPVGASTTTDNVNANDVSGGKVTGTSGFHNGDYVTYHAPATNATFTSGQVDTQWNGSAWVATTGTDTDNVYFAVDADSNNSFDDMGFSSGQIVRFYTSSVGLGVTTSIGLVNGAYYWIIRKSGQSYQFADTKCHATASVADCGAGSHSVTPLAISGAGSSSILYTLTAANQAPITGLFDGHGYYVVGCPASGCDASGYQLSSTSGGSAIAISNSATTIDGVGFTFSGGAHTFRTEGIDFTGAGANVQKLIFAIAPVAGPGPKNEKLAGIGTTVPFSAIGGDQVVSASATGGGGGAISVSTASSWAWVDATVTTTVGGGASVTGGSIQVSTDGHGNAKAISSNDSGGLISVNDAQARADVRVTSTVSVEAGATLTSLGALTISANGALDPYVKASSDSGGLFAGGSGGETAHIDYTTLATIAGALVSQNGTATVEAHTALYGYAEGTAELGTFAGAAKTYTRRPRG